MRDYTENRSTKFKKFFYEDEADPSGSFLDNIPQGTTARFLYEYRIQKEQWANYQVIEEVCKDSCGRVWKRKKSVQQK